MPKHEFLTPKAISNRIKSKGLQKLRWYCQMCQKQCRDEVTKKVVFSSIVVPLLFLTERIQVSHELRVSSEATASGGRKPWKIYWSLFTVSTNFVNLTCPAKTMWFSNC